jgi:hypothetical protein
MTAYRCPVCHVRIDVVELASAFSPTLKCHNGHDPTKMERVEGGE